MQYSKVYINAFAYELPSIVVTTQELEERLRPVYEKLRVPLGQLEAITGIKERRWWPENFQVATGATIAAEKAIEKAGIPASEVDTLIYAGVCRDYFEPATACKIAADLGLREGSSIYDISNACLGVLNGIVDIANRIELGQIRAGVVVSCETARDVNDDVIHNLIKNPNMELFKTSLATLTGGSGAAAVVLTDGSFDNLPARKLIGGVTRSAVEHHDLCRWGVRKIQNAMFEQFMITDAVNVLKYGLSLGIKTWHGLLTELGWAKEVVDKIISHQVGESHRSSILKGLGIDESKDYATYPWLGNIGTVSVPLSAAIAEERGFLKKGDQVGLLGIGSGLNCMMMGIQW